jgi:hypothetical protein
VKLVDWQLKCFKKERIGESLMSQYQAGPARFRESLSYQDIINHAVEAWRLALSGMVPEEVQGSTNAMLLLVTPGICDSTFSDQRKTLESEEEAAYVVKMADYKKQVYRARGGCPDLVPKPRKGAGIQHWEKLGSLCLALFERKNLLLKQEREESA